MAPATIRQLPKASMKPLTTQLSAVALPPSVRPMAGVATAAPVKDSGRISPAMQTAASTSQRLACCGC